MKKQLLITATLVLAALAGRAQKTDIAQMMIHYKYSWIQDTANRAHPFTENMVLYIGNSAAAYRSYDAVVYKAQFKKAYAEAVAASPDGYAMINRKGVGTPTEYYQYPNEKKLVIKEDLFVNSYAITGPMPAIDWKTSGDTATFGGLHCQKATGHFKGRDYIVWYCPDLPVHTGPWKLNGLPGVIVDARDSKNEVVFQFDGVEKTIPTPSNSGPAIDEKDMIARDLNDDMNLIAPPPRAIKTTEKEFKKVKDALRKNPNGVLQGMSAADGPRPEHIMAKMGPAPSRPAINNPVELSEK